MKTRRLLPTTVLALFLPLAAAPLDTLAPEHPRLFLTPERQAEIEAQLPTDPLLQDLVDVVIQYADEELTSKVFSREVDPGDTQGRIKDQRRGTMFRVFNTALAWRLTGNEAYARRVRDDLLSGAGLTLAQIQAADPSFTPQADWSTHQPFTDWGPGHYLNVGEISAAMAVGYDWIHDFLTPAQRDLISAGFLTRGLNRYRSDWQNAWWRQDNNNWNQVVNGGAAMLALAFGERYPAEANDAINKAVDSIRNPMESFKPDGAWPEGPTYYAYGATYNAFLIGALRSALGNIQGLESDDGYLPFGRSGAFHIQTIGPDNLYFRFGDAKDVAYFSPVLFFLSHEFDNDVYAFYERRLTQKDLPRLQAGLAMDDDTLDRFLAFLVVWYNGAGETLSYDDLPLDAAFRGESANAAMRSDWTDPDAIYLAFKGGFNKADHGHADVGSFVLDALGTRWAEDLGGDDYDLPGYFDFNSGRWRYFRNIAEGHNTLTIGNSIQNPNANVPLAKFYTTPEMAYSTMDMTQAYQGQATSVKRGFALLDRGRVLVEDEIAGAPQGDVIRWGMITYADVQLQGNKAVLARSLPSDGEPVTVTLDTVADAMIRNGGNAGNNYGGRSSVDIKGTADDFNRKGYFRFDLSTLPQPLANLTGAKFRVKNADTDNLTRDFNFWALDDAVNHPGRLGEDWLEGAGNGAAVPGALTWNNAPGNNTGNRFFDAAHALELGSVNANPAFNGWLEFSGDTTSNFASALRADSNGLFTVMLRRNDNSSDNEDFYSKENTSPDAEPAQLELTFQEPGPTVTLEAEILEPAGASFIVKSTTPTSPPGQNPNLGTRMLAVEIPAGTEPTRIVVLLTPKPDGAPDLPAPAFRPLSASNPSKPIIDIETEGASIEEFGETSTRFAVRRTGDVLANLNVPVSFAGTATAADFTSPGTALVLPFPTNGTTSHGLEITAVADSEVEGDETLTLTAGTNAAWELGTASATVTIRDKPSDAWRHVNDAAAQSWDSDDDHDGLTLLEELALGGTPGTNDAALRPHAILEPLDSEKHLTLHYTKPIPAPADLIYTPMVGSSLISWDEGPGFIAETTGNPSNDRQSVTARDLAPMSAHPRRFMALDLRLLE